MSRGGQGVTFHNLLSVIFERTEGLIFLFLKLMRGEEMLERERKRETAFHQILATS